MDRPRTPPSRAEGPRAALVLGLAAWLGLAAGCGGAERPHSSLGAVEEAASSADEAAEAPPDAGSEQGVPSGACELSARAPGPSRQLAVFERWLRDQAVGRRIRVESVEPVCGLEGGCLVVRVVLAGRAGELLSLGRALEAYYPGARWRALEHRRLEAAELALRLRTEIRLPSGAEPRPRCTWDPAARCP